MLLLIFFFNFNTVLKELPEFRYYHQHYPRSDYRFSPYIGFRLYELFFDFKLLEVEDDRADNYETCCYFVVIV